MLSVFDILGGGLCVAVLWLFFSARIKKYNPIHKRLYINAFKFKMICSILFALITAYYYKGGDTEMFLFAVRDMKTAIQEKQLSLGDLLFMEKVSDTHPLAYYFQQDISKYYVIGFMQHGANFIVPKLGITPYLLFFNSYLAMCFVFSFFALSGAIRLYKLFLNYFPKMHREIAIATLFLPSACYWSSGFLKDSICFGAVGFLLYGLFMLLIKREKQLASLFWVVISIYLLYTAKIYILLALIPGIGFWLFGELSFRVKKGSLRTFVTIISIVVAGIGAFMFINYLTSNEALSKFSMENILESSEYSRKILDRRAGEGSSFEINTSNPFLLTLNGLVATFFRPFPWEVSSIIVLFSAIESLIFLALMIFLFYKKGFAAPFNKIFKTPILTLSFSFAIIFAVSVGISTTNFGSLSRYKIPCLSFYLMFVLGAYHLTGLSYPGWLQRILDFATGKKKVTHVRHSRVY